MINLSFDTIWEQTMGNQYDEKLTFKIAFDTNETGWGYRLDDERSVLVNTPLSPDLNFLDIVTVEPGTHFECVSQVVRRTFPCKTRLQYNTETAQACFRRLKARCFSNRIGCAAMVKGIAYVAHHQDTDFETVFAGCDGDLLDLHPLLLTDNLILRAN